MLRCNTVLFRSEHDGYWFPVRYGCIIIDGFFSRGNQFQARIGKETQCLSQTVFSANGNIHQRSGRSFDGIGIDGGTAFSRNDNGIDTGTLTRTGNGAEIAHVGYAIENHHKRLAALLVKPWNDIFEPLKAYRRNKGNDALVIFGGQKIKFLQRYFLNGHNPALQCCLE